MLRDPSLDEIKLLSAMHYQTNEVVLHLDTNLLPRRKAAHASWNYLIEQGDDGGTRLPCLTYNMNVLQHIQSEHTFCVSLNASERIDPEKVLRTFTYHHPLFNRASLEAQQRRDLIQGRQHSWFCGAYWHNGFHEDGVRSALDVVAGLSELQEQPVQKGAA
jgi:predicted NAD/FAD-binding protein